MDFFVTDHSLRHPEMVSTGQLREIYREMKRQGISSIRFDWDWDESFPESGKPDRKVLDRYVEAMKMMQEEGLEAPTLVLYTPPEWATKLYEEDKEAYFSAYREYLQTAADSMEVAGLKAHSAQLANEVNHPLLYQFLKMEDFPRVVKTAREVFSRSQPEMKFTASVIVSNFADKIGEVMGKPKTTEFLDQHEKELTAADFTTLDYYPGMWHFPMRFDTEKSAFPIKRSANPIKEAGNVLNRTFKDTEALKAACETVAGWGKPYELGETGFPTNYPYSQGRRQRMFYDMFLRGVRQMMEDFHHRGVALPKRVGIYETQDEPNRGFGIMLDKILNAPGVRQLARLSPFPEGNFGLMTKKGGKQEILRGTLKEREPSTSGVEQISQLKKLISYVNRPFSDERSGKKSDELEMS
ncbi:MAG: hypothetical protein M1275_03615 [Patescibacteria group bacterium]|nr:hypothetical protein [Patescibacteria group bacterium]